MFQILLFIFILCSYNNLFRLSWYNRCQELRLVISVVIWSSSGIAILIDLTDVFA